ncbi:MAG: hypothetical protein K6U11_14500 [bacterium]|nr:hypothetical protein [bacterium]
MVGRLSIRRRDGQPEGTDISHFISHVMVITPMAITPLIFPLIFFLPYLQIFS